MYAHGMDIKLLKADGTTEKTSSIPDVTWGTSFGKMHPPYLAIKSLTCC